MAEAGGDIIAGIPLMAKNRKRWADSKYTWEVGDRLGGWRVVKERSTTSSGLWV